VLRPSASAPRVLCRLFLALLAAAWPAGLAAQPTAQDPHTAQPERPTVATHAGTVATGWIEIEAGIEIDRYADRSRGLLSSPVTKIGLARRLQLNVVTPIVRPPGPHTASIGDVSVGVKWRLVDDAPVAGDFAVLPSVKVPSGSAESGAGTATTDVGLLLISSHTLGPVSMDINLGYTRRSGNGAGAPRAASLWTISFGGPAAGGLGWTAELYGYPATSGPAGAAAIVAVLAGPTLQVRRWLVLDAGVIVPVAGPQPRALYAGFVANVCPLWHRPARDTLPR
jgi:hypothetical protein